MRRLGQKLQPLMDNTEHEYKIAKPSIKIPKIDGNALKCVFYFLSTRQMPSSDSSFSDLRKLYSEHLNLDEIPSKTKEIIQALKELKSDYGKYQKMLIEDIPTLSYWSFVACDPFFENKNVLQRNKRKEEFDELMNQIAEQIDAVMNENKDKICRAYSPTQSAMFLIGSEPPLIQQLLNDVRMLSTKPKLINYKPVLNSIPDMISKLINTITIGLSAQSNRKLGEPKEPPTFANISFDDLLQYRDQICQFAFYTGHIDKSTNNSFSVRFSTFLYHVDNILYALAAIPTHPCNPIDVSTAATDLLQCMLFFKVQSDLVGFVTTIKEAYSTGAMIRGTNQKTVEIVFKITNNFEEFLVLPAIQQDPFKGYFFAVSFARLSFALKKIDPCFESGAFLPSKNDILDLDKNQKDLQKTETNIVQLNGKKVIDLKINAYQQYYINPSRTAHSITPITDSIAAKRAASNLKSIQEKLDSLNDEYRSHFGKPDLNETEEIIRKTNKTIVQAFPVADFGDEKTEFFYCIDGLNKLIDFAHQHISSVLPDPTSGQLIQSIVKMLGLIKNDIFAASTGGLKAKTKECAKRFNEMNQFFSKCHENIDDTQIVDMQTQLQEDLDYLQNLKVSAEIDSVIRESYFENHITSITESLAILIARAKIIKPGVFNIDDAAEALSKTVSELTAVYESVTVFNPSNVIFAHFLSRNRHIINIIHEALFVDIENEGQEPEECVAAEECIQAVTQLKANLEGVIPVMRLVNNIASFSGVLSQLSNARYCATHLQKFYENDAKLLEFLQKALSLSDKIIAKFGDYPSAAQYKAIQKTIKKIQKKFKPGTERTGREIDDSATEITCLLNRIYVLMCQPDKFNTKKMSDEMREALNNCLPLLGYEKEVLEIATNPYDQFKKTFFEPYARVFSESCGMSPDLEKYMRIGLDMKPEDYRIVPKLFDQLEENYCQQFSVEQVRMELIRDTVIPLFASFCNYKKMQESEMLKATKLIVESPDNIHQGIFEMSAIIRRISHEEVSPDGLAEFLQSGNLADIQSAYFSCVELLPKIPELSEVLKIIINYSKGEDDIHVHDFSQILKQLRKMAVNSIHAELSTLVVENPIPLCISNDFGDYDRSVLDSLVENNDEGSFESFDMDEEALNKLLETLSAFEYCETREMLFIGIGGLASQVSNAVSSGKTERQKAIIEQISQKWKVIIEQAKDSSTSHGIITPSYALDAFAFRLSNLLKLVQPHTNVIGFWGEYVSSILETLSEVAGDSVQISMKLEFIKSIGPGIRSLCQSSIAVGITEAQKTLDAYDTLLNICGNINATGNIIEAINEAIQNLEKTEKVVSSAFPRMSASMHCYISLFIDNLKTVPSSSFDEADDTLISVTNGVANLPLLMHFSGDDEVARSLIYSLNACRMALRQFDPIIFQKMINKAVSSMKCDNVDNDTMLEVESMGICSKILAKSISRRHETGYFLHQVSEKLENMPNSCSELMKCYNYICSS